MKCRYVTLFILIFSLLVSCNTSKVINTDKKPVAQNSIFNDSDIDNATLQLANDDLSPEELSKLILNTDTSQLSTTASNSGFIYYFPKQLPSHKILEAWRFDLANNINTLVYTGKREIRSIAGSLDGNTIILSLKSTTDSVSNFEVYRLQVNPKKVFRLTKTTFDETFVSSSADGRHIAWQRQESDFNKVYGRVYLDTTTTSVYHQFNLQHYNSQRYPRISSSGRYLALVRELEADPLNRNDRLYVYDLQVGDYKFVAKSSAGILYPSVG